MKFMKDNRRWLGIVLLIAAPSAAARAAESLGARPSPSARRVPLAVAQAQGAEAAPSDAELRETARRGMGVLMNGDPDGAIEIFQQIQKADPQSPLGFLLEADATWWKIYLTTGDLVDPDVFDVARSSTSPYDSDFEDMVNAAIRKANARVHAHQDEARSYLYEGMAYGLKGRFYGLRDNDLPTARAGKKMRALLLTALKMDPGLEDAYLGLGIYNYFVDTLPTIVKMLKFLIGLPPGDRELGLEQLRQATDKGDLVRDEAKFYLAKDLSRRSEAEFDESLELFRQLAREYLDNMLWTLLAGSLRIRLGHAQQGEDMYREAFTKTKGMQSEVGQALHREARKALVRRHPNERIED
jgi:tetratricopeptide (TPR) repeat protein